MSGLRETITTVLPVAADCRANSPHITGSAANVRSKSIETVIARLAGSEAATTSGAGTAGSGCFTTTPAKMASIITSGVAGNAACSRALAPSTVMPP